MVGSERENSRAIRVLVVARHPFRAEDLGVGTEAAPGDVHLIRRPGEIETAIDEAEPDVVLIDTGFAEGNGFKAMETAVALAPEAGVLALTPSPPPYADVARATRAGAVGFVHVDAGAREFDAALSAVAQGGEWFPLDDMRPMLSAVAADLDVTAAERRSRLTGILVGLIPLAGLVAALMAYLWRKYLAQVGVRPVDLAVDPASRVIDAVAGILLLLGAFGPLMFVGTWLDMLRGSPVDRGPISWLLDRRKTAHVLMSLLWLFVAWILALGPDAALVLVVGPLVGIAVIARAADVGDELPRLIQIKVRPKGVLIGTLAALLIFLGALGGEALFYGPEFGPRGAGGVLVPRVLGFRAQPMLVFAVDDDALEPREMLYLGGNADLYVLVDPCNENEIELVSVGAHRLVVIDEVTCAAPDDN